MKKGYSMYKRGHMKCFCVHPGMDGMGMHMHEAAMMGDGMMGENPMREMREHMEERMEREDRDKDDRMKVRKRMSRRKRKK